MKTDMYERIEGETLLSSELLEHTYYKNCHIILEEDAYEFKYVVLESCLVAPEKMERLEVLNASFINCDFSNFEFDKSYFNNVTFKNCKLTGTLFNGNYFRDTKFENCLMRYVSFAEGKLQGMTWKECDVTEGIFMNMEHKKFVMKNCKIERMNFSDTKMRGVDLTECDFQSILYSIEAIRGVKIRSDQAVAFAIQMGFDVVDA